MRSFVVNNNSKSEAESSRRRRVGGGRGGDRARERFWPGWLLCDRRDGGEIGHGHAGGPAGG